MLQFYIYVFHAVLFHTNTMHTKQIHILHNDIDIQIDQHAKTHSNTQNKI